MSFHCSLWSIKHALYDVCYLLHAKNECIYFSKAHIRYSTVQYGLVKFLCRFRTTFCASFRWCWPLDSRDVAPRDVVDIFCLLGRVLVVVFARVFFISPDYKYSQCRKSQWISVPHMQHCQFFHKSKIKKAKFTHLGGSSVKGRLHWRHSRVISNS